MTITIAAIVVGIGVDDCIHYVHRFKREFSVDRDYLAAMYRCHNSIGRAMYYTTLTLVIGFSTLMLSNFNPSIYFGALTIVAMTAAVVGALLLLPRLILIFKPLGAEAMTELPLFPLSAVLLPYGRMPLQIFEQRYLELVKSSMRSGEGFGIVRIERGVEIGSEALPELAP
jgi:multidrug efflux pump subunit AcrB